ncbi:MAG: hypothetical protein KF862_12545 [Chitinophagaceae bacterium]|nr:hypothetical protein [Chitinophagaceae bacterium]
MHKTLLLFLYIAFSCRGYTQQSDFISLKKKGYTVKSYFKGAPFEFVHSNGSTVSGVIERIYNDTVFMVLYDVRMSPTFWGTTTPDTIAKYDLRFHYKEIAAIPKPDKGFEFVRNGTLLMIGGGGYAFLHTFNGLIQKKEIKPSVIAISGGVALLGFGMKKLRKYYYPIGKKYTIEYIKMTS